MTRAARRRTASLQVYLGAGETEQWASDPAFVRDTIASFRTQARERGRSLVEVYSDVGDLLQAVRA